MVAGRMRSATFAAAMLIPVGTAPAVAAPAPDIDALIDDSGPLPQRPGDPRPDPVFSTDTGLVCALTHEKLAYQTSCSGDIPGAPAGTRSVQLRTIYLGPSGPAAFTRHDFAPDLPAAAPRTTLTTGHKIVFWDHSASEKLACGIPPGVVMVCVLDASPETGPQAGVPERHGFVIATPQSSVF